MLFNTVFKMTKGCYSPYVRRQLVPEVKFVFKEALCLVWWQIPNLRAKRLILKS